MLLSFKGRAYDSFKKAAVVLGVVFVIWGSPVAAGENSEVR